MDIAIDYIRAGLVLVPLPPNSKRPEIEGWNTRARCVSTEEAARRLNGGGLGLAHLFCEPSPTMALDVDDYQKAVPWLEERGINLIALLGADDAVQIRSGRPNHCKLLFRLPHAMQTLQLPEGGLELRCASKKDGRTVQDALPPGRNPDSGKVYEWHGDFRNIPRVPAALLELWHQLLGTGKSSHTSREDEDADSDPILSVLKAEGMVLRRVKEGTYAIRCPFESSHTTQGGESATVYWLPWYGGFQHGAFKCLHSHCSARTREDFLRALGIEYGGESAEWPDPEPLPSLPDVAPFHYEFLPLVLREYVADIAERMQAPPDYPAMACIVMCGSIIGRKLRLYPRQHGDWGIVPNLWAMAIGRPGFKKSPSLDAALAPVQKLQERAFEQWSSEQKARDLETKRAKIQAKVNHDQARAALRKNRLADVTDLLSEEEEPEDPEPRRYIVNDSTVEALAEILEANANGVLLNRDELSGWFASLEKEGQQAARSFFLTASDGDKAYTVDRIMRGKHRHIDALCISMVGGIQPGLLARHVRDTQQFGSGDDGLLQRFGLAVYPDLSPRYELVDRVPDAAAYAAIMQIVEHLDQPDLAIVVGAEADSKGHFLRFAPDARRAFEEWEIELQHRVRGVEEHPSMRSHLAKYPRLVGALSLIFHVVDNPMQSGPVSSAALARALALSQYLETHAQRIYSYATRPEVEAAGALLSRIKAGKLSSPFSLRDVYRKCWAGLSEPDQVFQAVKLLAELNWVREASVDTAGRPAKVFHINPKAKAAV